MAIATSTVSNSQLRVKKRDGSIEPFNEAKIRRAVIMAWYEVKKQAPSDKCLATVVHRVTYARTGVVGVDTIHGQIESTLSEDWPDVALAYKRYREERDTA